jgi:subtilisin family serine protease
MQAVLRQEWLPNLAARRGPAAALRTRLIAVLLSLAFLASYAAIITPTSLVDVIVRSQPGTSAVTMELVRRVGGQVLLPLDVIDGFAARVPFDALARLLRDQSVVAVTPDSTIELHHADDIRDALELPGSMYNLSRSINAHVFWQRGITGRGVDVALIDTGVLPVPGVDGKNKLIYGPDISFESQDPELRHFDTYGHGTHLAGIIAARDGGPGADLGRPDRFVGMAPGARLVSLKVANRVGAADVSQVIAAIDWVVQHGQKHGLNIRVLNLSFGTDSTQDYRLDPLSFAAEVAWRHGIVVVTAAGNGRTDGSGLNNPAYNPFLLAVGAADGQGTQRINDDVIMSWSSRGDGVRNPDLVAPGRSVVSLRAYGSHLDELYPTARTGERYFRGSGTSQAAAVVAGAAALIVEQRPGITPDQLKGLLVGTANKLSDVSSRQQGAGMIDLRRAFRAATPDFSQDFEPATGTGSLDAGRGTRHVVSPEGDVLRGEVDIFGNAWEPEAWAEASAGGWSWSGGDWMGHSWSGHSWSGHSWSGHSWSGHSWSGHSWSGSSWSGHSWSGSSWSGSSWSSSWSGHSWTGSSWSGSSWSGNSWSGSSWSSPFWD